MKLNANIIYEGRLLTVIFLFVLFQLNNEKIIAQENKQDKCSQLTDCMQTFYKECYNEEFLNNFSPKMTHQFKADESNQEMEIAYLDNLFEQLNINTQATGYIVVYGGRINKINEYEMRVRRIKGYIKYKNQDESRFKIVHGGFREKFEFEFWLSPIKNAFPPLSPTVAPEKVKFKGKMKPPAPGDSIL